MSLPANQPQPKPFPADTQEQTISVEHVELAGWGGGPGYVMSIYLVGKMWVRQGESGLLRLYCRERVLTSKWLAERLGAVDPTPAKPDGHLERAYIKAGTTLFAHVTHIRMMG